MNKQFLKLTIFSTMMIHGVMASSLDIMNDDNQIKKSIETNTENSDLICQEQAYVKLKQIQNTLDIKFEEFNIKVFQTIQDIGQRINTIEDKFNEFQKQTNSKHKYTYQGIGKIPQGTTDLLINGIKYFPFSSIVDPTTIE